MGKKKKNNTKKTVVKTENNNIEKQNEIVNVCIGIPHTGTFPWQTTMSLLGLQVPRGFKVYYHLVGSCLVYDAREKIVKFARENNCKYILMLDSDMVPPKDTLLKMIGLLEVKPEICIVSGMIFKRTPPFQPCFYNKLEYNLETKLPYLESPIQFPNKGHIPCQGVGMACCLIRTSIFDTIDEARGNKNSYFYPLPNLGEDLTFCLVANKFGYIVTDLSIDVGHVSAMPITSGHFHACKEQHEKENNGKMLFEEDVKNCATESGCTT